MRIFGLNILTDWQLYRLSMDKYWDGMFDKAFSWPYSKPPDKFDIAARPTRIFPDRERKP